MSIREIKGRLEQKQDRNKTNRKKDFRFQDMFLKSYVADHLNSFFHDYHLNKLQK